MAKSSLRSFKLFAHAANDLANIKQYGEANYGIARTRLFLRELNAIFKLLRNKSYELGTHRNEIKPNLYSYPFKQYVIYFYRSPSEIKILRVLRGEQNSDVIFQ